MFSETHNGIPGGSAIPLRAAPALLLAMLLMVAALAACGGGDAPTTRPERVATQTEATEPSASTADPEATREADPNPPAKPPGQKQPSRPNRTRTRTHRGIRQRRVQAQRERRRGVRLRQRRGRGTTPAVMRRDGSVACWGFDGWGQATPPVGLGVTAPTAPVPSQSSPGQDGLQSNAAHWFLLILLVRQAQD